MPLPSGGLTSQIPHWNLPVYIWICFILFIAFLFLFLRDTDSRQGTSCPFCVPIRFKNAKNLFIHMAHYPVRRFLRDIPTF